jgi:hypothetical protein
MVGISFNGALCGYIGVIDFLFGGMLEVAAARGGSSLGVT